MYPPSSPSSSSSFTEFHSENLTLTLIPGLPHDLAALILAFLPYSYHGRLKSICKSWRYFFSSRTLHSIRRKHLPFAKRSHLLCIFPQDPSVSSPFVFDPRNLAWCYLPPMPCNPHVYGLCNFTSVAHDSHLYVLGGSLFDTRSFPLDRPSPSSSAFRYDFVTHNWDTLPPMLSPRGSFACAAVPNTGRILVAGGGSRHTMFGAAGSRMSSVEMYDIGRNEWMALDGLPRFRAGCVGFMVGNGDEEKEFWVMGGYGESRTILGVFPVDEIYRDAVVMKLKNGGVGKWRELGDMWEEGERSRLGRIAIVDDINGVLLEFLCLTRMRYSGKLPCLKLYEPVYDQRSSLEARFVKTTPLKLVTAELESVCERSRTYDPALQVQASNQQIYYNLVKTFYSRLLWSMVPSLEIFPGLAPGSRKCVYDMTSNRWWKETSVPKRAADESSVGFVALDGELYVMALHSGADSTENRRSRRHKRSASLFLQIYHPEKKIWRTLVTKPPFQQSLDFKTAVTCTIRL
ncbi:hypothetical protein OSB04_000915 [Centaurea solstitialis]|uniref:F-box domain-containing protein n=1 Tax=Centaurea solstitialis TaxID=347529 RepID=A0AA38WU52_9ASTR|nr:hypothetical protein OSB04_000915 [Centaurea solstitialis]